MRRALAIGSVVAVLVGAATALAGGNGVLASANGDYGFSGQAAGSTFEIGPFTWNVQVKADGSVKGRFDYTQVRDGGVAAVGERPADLCVHRGRPRVGRRCDRGELAGEPRRARDVVPGSRQRGGRERCAGHVLDPRRRCGSGGPAVLRRPSTRQVPLPRQRGQSAGAKRLRRSGEGRARSSGPRRPEVRRVRARGSDPASRRDVA